MNIVILAPGGLGDALLIFPIILALRAKYSNPHITFIGNAWAIPLVKQWGYADEVLPYEKQVNDELYSTIGIQHPTWRDLFEQTDFVAGWRMDSDGVVKQNLLKAGVKEVILGPVVLNANNPTHVVQYMANMLALPIQHPEQIVVPTMKHPTICSAGAPIALHIGSTTPIRCWPAKSFATLIVRLLRLQYGVLLLAGPTDTKMLKEIRRHLKKLPRQGRLTVLENAPILEVAKLLNQCGAFVGNDSGPAHLSGVLGIPTLVLFGPSVPAHFRPLGPTVEILQHQPFKKLAAERVLESTLRIYNTHLPKA